MAGYSIGFPNLVYSKLNLSFSPLHLDFLPVFSLPVNSFIIYPVGSHKTSGDHWKYPSLTFCLLTLTQHNLESTFLIFLKSLSPAEFTQSLLLVGITAGASLSVFLILLPPICLPCLWSWYKQISQQLSPVLDSLVHSISGLEFL